jgi:hypothetical protein
MDMFDAGRDRAIPVMLYFPGRARSCTPDRLCKACVARLRGVIAQRLYDGGPGALKSRIAGDIAAFVGSGVCPGAAGGG